MPKTKEQIFLDLKAKLPTFITLDESTYTKFDQPARFIDAQYGEYFMSPKNASKGQKHKKRAYAERSIKNKLSISAILAELPPHITLDTSTYINTHKKARFIDAEYGEFFATPNFVRNGGNHRKRSRQSTVHCHMYTDEQANAALPDGIKLKFGTYTNSNSVATFIDPETKEEFSAVFASVQAKKVVPPSKKASAVLRAVHTKIHKGQMNILPNGKYVTDYCREFDSTPTPSHANMIYTSQGPEEAQKWIESHSSKGSNIEIHLMKSLNIDRFNRYPEVGLQYKPDFKLSDTLFLNADGLYWHCDVNKSPNYHFDLRVAFESKGLRILQFRQNEILMKNAIIKSIVQNAIGGSIRKINARSCANVGVDLNAAKDFLVKNHIKGYHPSCKYLGLEYNGELVCVIGFKIIKNNLKIERFCSIIGSSIRGALGKLITAVEDQCSGKYQAIHYWVDLRYGTGNSLKQLGFTLSHDVLSFEWTDGNNTFNRRRCRANMDSRRLTERQHAKELKWYKIYDAGQRLFVKKC